MCINGYYKIIEKKNDGDFVKINTMCLNVAVFLKNDAYSWPLINTLIIRCVWLHAKVYMHRHIIHDTIMLF